MDSKPAAGLIIYRLQQTPEFLLINDTFAGRRHWTPPKGYVLNGEDTLKTALREANELTGLSARDLRVEPNFTKSIRYLSDSRPKTVTYHLAQISDHGRVVPSSESLHFGWFNPTVAGEKLLYKNIQEVITAAVDYIDIAVAEREREREQREREQREREQREREQRLKEREREQRDRRPAPESAPYDRRGPPAAVGGGGPRSQALPPSASQGSGAPPPPASAQAGGRRPYDSGRANSGGYAEFDDGRDSYGGGYDGPARGGFNGPSRGGYDGPSRGGYDGPNRGYDGPNRGYDGPNRGGYDGPNRGYDGPARGYDGPARGGYDGPNRGYDGPARGGYDGPARGGYDGPARGYDGPARGYDGPARGGYDGPARGYDGPARGGYDGPSRGGNDGPDRFDGPGRPPGPPRGLTPTGGRPDQAPYYGNDDRSRPQQFAGGRNDRDYGYGPESRGRPSGPDAPPFKGERYDREAAGPGAFGGRGGANARGQGEFRGATATPPAEADRASPSVSSGGAPGPRGPPPGVRENPLYKTKLCERFMTDGACPYGDRCHFAHGDAELRPRPTYPPGAPDGGRYRGDSAEGGYGGGGRYPDSGPYGNDGGYGGGNRGSGYPQGGRPDGGFDEYNGRPRGPPPGRFGPDGNVPPGILGPAPQYLGPGGAVRPQPGRGFPAPPPGGAYPYDGPSYGPRGGNGPDGGVGPNRGGNNGGRPFWSGTDDGQGQRRPTPWDVGAEPGREPRASRTPSGSGADDKPDDRFTATGEPVRKPGAYRPPAAKQREADAPASTLSMKSVERALPATTSTTSSTAATAPAAAAPPAAAAAPAAAKRPGDAANGKAAAPAPASTGGKHRGRNARDEVTYVLEREEARPAAAAAAAVSSTSTVDKAAVLRQYKGSLEESLETELRQFFASGKSLADEVREVQRREVRHDLTKQQLFNVLVPALFYGDNLLALVESRKAFLSKFVVSQSDQVALLRAWERYYAREEEALHANALLVVKKLYDLDLADEDAFLAWNEPQSASALKTRVQPFLNWLKEAEVQSD